jgi:leucine-rich repeat protein SHOC2
MGDATEEQWVSESGRVWRCRDKGLIVLPPTLAHIDTLQEIDASMNDLKFVNVAHEGQWPALRKLILNDNELSALPNPIAHFSLLTHLELADNQVTQLGEEVGVMRGLEVLDVHGNRLTSLPDALSTLTHLRSLKLGFNQLSKAPAWLGMLPALEILDLQSNRLTSLPVELSHLTSLKELYLSKNKLLKLPVEYHALTQLKVLQLDQNDLVDPPQYMAKLGPEHILAYLRAIADESGS